MPHPSPLECQVGCSRGKVGVGVAILQNEARASHLWWYRVRQALAKQMRGVSV